MQRFLIRRILFAVLTLFASSAIVFYATEILPGDIVTAILGQGATPELIQNLRAALDLDRPVLQRYVHWLAGFLTGDLGTSLATRAPVLDVVLPRFQNTMLLAAYTAIVAVPISLGLGLLSAAWAESRFDRALNMTSVFLVSIPEFSIGLILVIAFAVQLHLFPAVVIQPNWSNPIHAAWQLFLPMLTLMCTMVAHLVRMTRSTILDVLSTGYVEFALLKGASKWRILLRHALPNAAGPILSVVALNLGYLISGVAIVEVVFSYPGLGRLMIDSISYRDMPLIQTTAMIFCALYIFFNILADLLTILINPRIAQSL